MWILIVLLVLLWLGGWQGPQLLGRGDPLGGNLIHLLVVVVIILLIYHLWRRAGGPD